MSLDHESHSAPHVAEMPTVEKKTSTVGKNGVINRAHDAGKPLPSLLAHEWGFWTAFVVGVFLLLVLFSYDPADPGFFSSGNFDNIHNWGDSTGAWLSSFLLFVFGVFAYVIPFGVWMVGSVVFWIKVENQKIDKNQLIKSSGSLALMLSSGAGMATMYLDTHDWTAPLPYSGGGMWGYFVASIFIGLVDRLAATLTLLLLFGVSISWMLGVSWFRIMDVTGELLWNAFYQGRRWLLVDAKPKWAIFKELIVTRYHQYREGHHVIISNSRDASIEGKNTEREPAHWQKTLFSFIRWHQAKPEDRVVQRPVGEGYGVEPNFVTSLPVNQSLSEQSNPISSLTQPQPISESAPIVSPVTTSLDSSPISTTTISVHQVSEAVPVPSGIPATIVIDPTIEPSYPIHLSSTPEAWSAPIVTDAVTEPHSMVTNADVAMVSASVAIPEAVHESADGLMVVAAAIVPEASALSKHSVEEEDAIEEYHASDRQFDTVDVSTGCDLDNQVDMDNHIEEVNAYVERQEEDRFTPKGQSASVIPITYHQGTQTAAILNPAHAQLPSLTLLNEIPERKQVLSDDTLQAMGQILEQSLQEYNIKAEVVGIVPGPVVTLFELQPAPGVRVGTINNLVKDLARSMSVMAVRVVDIIPGKSVIGIEMPNPSMESISFRELLASNVYRHTDMMLPLVLGKDTKGEPIVADLAKMPHVLVAGQTGSGKSVGVNAMIVSLLYHARADQVKFIMIDPKMLELSVYQDIPHLLAPVVTDMSEASNALRWCVVEMERRYQLMSKLGVRNIAGYNEKVQAAIDRGDPIIDPLAPMPELSTFDIMPDMPTLTQLPYIVVIVDEFADLFMVVGKKIEELIARLAQKARAAGIHLVLATQRPSVDVVTGLIKANIPARIAFKVAQKIDSRTILDQMGADQLLGRGDMLYLGNGMSFPLRVHGPFVSDEEVHRVVEFLKTQGKPDYQNLDLSGTGNSSNSPTLTGLFKDDAGGAERDVFYDEAVAFVLQSKKVSVSSVQRKFSIGYNRAARMVEAMEEAGVVSAPLPNGNREILVQNR